MRSTRPSEISARRAICSNTAAPTARSMTTPKKAPLICIEGSLKRLGVDQLDFVWVHDVAQDFHGDGWLGLFETARKGAFVALSQLRDQGAIKGWGLGVNKVQPVELLL